MSSLASMFRSTAEQPSDDERLLQLYWNRNELKKEFARLREEQYRLRNLLKEQKGAHARTRQQLDYLEELLQDTRSARSVVVHYQLRSAGERCRRRLEKFAEELKQQREKKLRERALASWNAELASELRSLESAVTDKRAEIEQLEHERDQLRRKAALATGLFGLFRRRRLNADIELITADIHANEDLERDLEAQCAEIRGRTPPDVAGLDLLAKRSINCMILAFAQQLYLQFGNDEFAGMVKVATEKSAGAVNYGDARECDRILGRLLASEGALGRAGDDLDVLKRRAKLLGENAHYETGEDAVPISGSVATLYRFDGNGAVRTADLDLVDGNYWNIVAVFSR